MASYGRKHRHLCQQVLDVFKDEGQSSEAIRFTVRRYLSNNDHQEKKYADVRRKPLEFQIEDKAMLKEYLSGETLAIQLDEIQIDDTLHSIEEHVKIMNHGVKHLKRSRILNVKSSFNSNNQADPKFQKDYKAEYKKMKAKLALLEASPSKVFDKEEVTQVKVLIALADDELTVGKSHARNGEWVDITLRKVNTLLSMDEDADWQNYLKYINIDLKFVEEQRLNLLSKYNKMVFELNKCRDELLILKQAKLDAVTFQIQNTELRKLNHALQEQLKEEKKINEKWLTSSKRSSSKMNENENLFVPASMSQVVNESLEPNETLNTPESSKDSKAESLTPLPPLKNLQGASPSSEVMLLTIQPHSPKERPGLGIMKHIKPETQDSSNKSVSGTVTISETKQTTPLVPTEVKDTKHDSNLNELTKLVQMLIDEKVNSNQKTQESNSKSQKTESSKSVDSSKINQDSKPKFQSTSSSKSLRPKPIQSHNVSVNSVTMPIIQLMIAIEFSTA
ncbi:hypothetical protein Tco_0785139 [Tanacetum coccineum]